jgi:hypothetical protein
MPPELLEESAILFQSQNFELAYSLVFAGPVYRTENIHRTELD